MRDFFLIPLAQREPNIVSAALTYGHGGSTIEVFSVNLLSLAQIMVVSEDTIKRFLFAEALKHIRIKMGIEGDIEMRWAELEGYVPPPYQPPDENYWDAYEASIGAPDPGPPKPVEPTFMELLKAVE